jgi:hypothetical protein
VPKLELSFPDVVCSIAVERNHSVMAAGAQYSGAGQEIGIDAPLLPGEPAQQSSELYGRVQKSLGTLRDQWLELSGFCKDPATHDWATGGRATAEGVEEYLGLSSQSSSSRILCCGVLCCEHRFSRLFQLFIVIE